LLIRIVTSNVITDSTMDTFLVTLTYVYENGVVGTKGVYENWRASIAASEVSRV